MQKVMMRIPSHLVFYRPELDVLRLLAFALVFLHHSFPAPLANGLKSRALRAVGEGSALGVSLFFFLSAYLITELLFREKRVSGSVNLQNFYLRRVLRIWPLYFAMLGIATLIGLVNPSEAVSTTGLLAYLFLSGNWWSSVHGFLPVLAGPLWSISVEEQFYVLWPVLARSIRRWMIITCGALIWSGAQMFLFWFTSTRLVTADQVWLNSIVQFQYFGLGIIVAGGLGGRVLQVPVLARVTLAIIGLTCMFLPEFQHNALGFNDVVLTRNVMFVYPLAGLGAVCLFCSFMGASMGGRWTGRLVYLGKISYGLYVFHLTAITVVLLLCDRLGIHHGKILAVYGVALPGTILFAHLSYQYFEKRFLRLKERFTVVHSRAD